ncbi:Uma2 family endonuclease [Spirulina subsalsa]|uniref:Uma2 family endonuclease n=1 Tax=Spirulina subsalsa TaxID=54311 RepID=UPI000319C822|nr:Uma2 family endonuclease [Spirulina subsalsa]
MITTIQLPQEIPSKEMSLQEFLNYDDGSDSRYELEDGKLLYMPSESDINQRIAMFLLAYFLQLGLPFYRLRIGAELAVMGSRATVRLPDLMVLTEELAQALSGASRSMISLEMPPPELVVEVVSPGRENEERDYRYKRAQYQARGIREYWIIDPMQEQITVLRLVRGLYEEAIFRGEEGMVSELLTEWGQREPLTVAQVLQVG